MRPALVSVADQIMLKRELDKLRRLTTQGSTNRRRSQGGGVKTAREEHVQVWATTGGPTVGDVLQSNANNLFLGRTRSWFNGTAAIGQTCWIGFVDWYDADSSSLVSYAIHGKHYYARRAGSATSGGTSLPFFVATQGNFECWCKADTAPKNPGDTVTVSLYNDDFTDSTINRASTLVKFIEITSTDQWCKLSREMGTYIVQPWGCPPP